MRCRDAGSAEGEIALSPDYYGAADFGASQTFGNYLYGYLDIKNRLAPAYGGNYPLTPVSLTRWSPQNQTYALCKASTPVCVSNSAENIVAVGGKQHLVLQNVFRTAIGEYVAIELEA